MVGARRVEQKKRVPGWRGVEHHEVRAGLRDDSRERSKYCDLLVARRAQVFGQQRLPCFVELGAARRHHPVDIGLRLGDRIDSAHRKIFDLPVERRGNVRSWICRAEVHLVTARRQLGGYRGGYRRLSDSPFAHDHHETSSRGRYLVNELRTTEEATASSSEHRNA